MLLREIGKLAIHLHATTPIPLTDRREFRSARRWKGSQKMRISERIKGAPGKGRCRQAAIRAVDIETDRPKLMMMALAHLEFRHPIKNLARIEVAKNPPLEFVQERWMNR